MCIRDSSWATDVSEKTFSWKNGVAYVAEKEYDDMSDDEKKEMFNGPKPERKVTAEMRQQAFDNYSTTAVSYTHLDVYKRQSIQCISRPPIRLIKVLVSLGKTNSVMVLAVSRAYFCIIFSRVIYIVWQK